MDPNIIVMITLLAMPNGEQSVHLKAFETGAACAEAAKIEVQAELAAAGNEAARQDRELTSLIGPDRKRVSKASAACRGSGCGAQPT